MAEPTLDAAFPLAPALVRSYQRDGHVLVRGLASRAEVEAFRPAIEDVVRGVTSQRNAQGRIDDYSSLFVQVTNIWRLSETARRLVCARRFAGVAAALLGVPAVRLYHDQALFKPSGADRTPWHQDRFYWPLDTDLTVTMWLALVDVDLDMGTMRFASGSHVASGLGELAISGPTDRTLKALIAERGWPIAQAPLEAGDATFHAGGTLHCAGANCSGRVREVLTVIYYPAGTLAAEPANPNQQADLKAFLPGVRPGAEARSPLNPVLYP